MGSQLADLYGASIRGVLSLAPRRGQRVVRLFGTAGREPGEDEDTRQQARYGFDHARRRVGPDDHRGSYRLARYVLRPPLPQGRLEPRSDGRVVLHLKRPWRDGTRAMVFEPLDLLAKLAALVPRPVAGAARMTRETALTA